ncbi:hypothetical protein EZS27_004728, partial [termite gut metagenome]
MQFVQVLFFRNNLYLIFFHFYNEL